MVCFAPPWFLLVYLCMNVGPQGPPATNLWGLLAAAWPAPFLPQSASLPWLPVSTPPTGLDECFFFISLVVGLPCGSVFCQFWLFFYFKLFLSFFLLCEEAPCVYLRLHLGFPPFMSLFKSSRQPSKAVSIFPIKKDNSPRTDYLLRVSQRVIAEPHYALPKAHTSLVIPYHLPQKQVLWAPFRA